MDVLYIRSLIFPVHTLGPGERVGLWLTGCPRRCPGCISPELWTQSEADAVDVSIIRDTLMHIEKARDTPLRLTVSGGEPLLQARTLLVLFEKLQQETPIEVLLFTGYTRAEIERGAAGIEAAKLLHQIDVLIDGPFVEALNDGLPMRGSSNQTIHYLSSTVNPLEWDAYLRQGRRVEANVLASEHVIFIGIPPAKSEKTKALIT